MQIKNDYTSFQNRNYQESHAHHITECLNEEQVKKHEGALGAEKNVQEVRNKSIEFSKDGDIYQMSTNYVTAKKKAKASGTGPFKNFWDALGDEGTESRKSAIAVLKDNLLSGIYGAATLMRDTLHHQVVERIQNVPVKVKAVIQSAGARFRHGQDAFTALTDGQTPSGRDNSDAEKRNKDRQVTLTGKEEDIPMKLLKHSYLTDSYSRKGEYCQLNDNLTYQNVRKGKNTL